MLIHMEMSLFSDVSFLMTLHLMCGWSIFGNSWEFDRGGQIMERRRGDWVSGHGSNKHAEFIACVLTEAGIRIITYHSLIDWNSRVNVALSSTCSPPGIYTWGVTTATEGKKLFIIQPISEKNLETVCSEIILLHDKELPGSVILILRLSHTGKGRN